LLLGPSGDELRGEELAKRSIFLPPAEPHEGQHGGGLLLLGLGSHTFAPAQRIAAVKDQMGHAFGVAYGIGDRYRATLRDAEQREALDAGGIDDGFQVAHEGLEGTLLDLAVGKAVAAGVVADQRMIPRELAIEMPPDRAFEVEFEMGHPVPGLDQRRSSTDPRIGKLDAVLRRAELNLLLESRLRLRSGGRGIRRCRRSRWLHLRKRLDLLGAEPEHPDRARNVLDGLLAEIGEGQRKLVPDLIVCRAGDAQPARLAQRLQPGRDVYAVAEDVVTVDDDVADVDADAEHDALILRRRRIAAHHPPLHGERAADRVDDASELDQHAVARGLDDVAAVAGDRGVDELATVCLERSQGADLVDAHQPAIADDVRRQDRREPALDALLLHGFSGCDWRDHICALVWLKSQLGFACLTSRHRPWNAAREAKTVVFGRYIFDKMPAFQAVKAFQFAEVCPWIVLLAITI